MTTRRSAICSRTSRPRSAARSSPVAHLVSSWNIDKARDFAWLNVQTLWELRRASRLFDAYTAALASTVGMGSRLLLTSLT